MEAIRATLFSTDGSEKIRASFALRTDSDGKLGCFGTLVLAAVRWLFPLKTYPWKHGQSKLENGVRKGNSITATASIETKNS